MREILFKAKRIDNGEWVEGYYFKARHHWHEHGIHEDWIAANAVQNGGWCNVCSKYAIDSDTLCQFTGLTDKNGNKIWENDVCSVNLICDDTEETEKCIVRYGRRAENFKLDLGFYVEWTKTDYLRMDICYWTENREVEVIGNAFDNADLIREV